MNTRPVSRGLSRRTLLKGSAASAAGMAAWASYRHSWYTSFAVSFSRSSV